MNASDNDRRPPPAFQLYAGDMMATERFYELPMAARGLALSIWFGVWVDRTVPADPRRLAVALRCSEAEVTAHLEHVLKSGLVQRHSTLTDRLMVDELERQRARLYERRRQQADAGARGGRSAQARLAEGREAMSKVAPEGEEAPLDPVSVRPSDRSSNRSGKRSSERMDERSSALKGTEPSRAERTSTPSIGGATSSNASSNREFIDDYEATEKGVGSTKTRNSIIDTSPFPIKFDP